MKRWKPTQKKADEKMEKFDRKMENYSKKAIEKTTLMQNLRSKCPETAGRNG